MRGCGDQSELVRGTGLRAGVVHNSGRKLAGHILALPLLLSSFTTFSQAPKLFKAIYKINKITYMMNELRITVSFLI